VTQAFSGSSTFFYKQLLWLFMAIIGGAIAALIDIEKIRDYSKIISIIVIAGLILVLIPGIGMEVNGSRRWLNLVVMRFQFSEFAKIGMVIVLANYLSENQREIKTFWRGFVIPCIWIGAVAFLVLLEPDFGTALLCGSVGLFLLFLAGTRLLFLLPSSAFVFSLFCVAVYFNPVRWKRITSFMDVEGNKSDGSYQLWQGILAFGAGGWDGVGLGNGRQQMSFLPEAHTDFIFPIIGEELGFFVTAFVVMLFGVILVAGVTSLKKAPNIYHFTLFAGFLFFLVLQSIINMGVVTGCLPTKGMSLPFISYGGSNLVLMFVFTGLMVNCMSIWARPAIMTPREL
jgi:cell division protein FtsW